LISILDHTLELNANRIWRIFQRSYAVEAKILSVENFPPLQRTIQEFLTSNSMFYACYIESDICGIIEVNVNTCIHIQSLVVDPDYFRRGIASRLITFLLLKYDNFTFSVETGLKNVPAIQLYKSFGFEQVSIFDTNHGVRKVRFKLIKSN
tara:strand:+ start:59 stop:511 length:453 start_codon:yes stop_codon:yes gene_type:complete